MRPLIVHVEAGLRSFDRGMPEEVNRIITDHLADVLFVSERSGLENLEHEGVPSGNVHFVGNTMIDSLLACREKAEKSPILEHLGLRKSGAHDESGKRILPYVLLTLHRPANVDHIETFVDILDALEESTGEYQVIFPAHPRTVKRIREFGLDGRFSWDAKSAKAGIIRIVEPLGYVDFLAAMK